MNWWEQIIRFFYQRSLNAKLQSTTDTSKIINLKDAKTVGIMYNSTQPDNDIIITKFAEHLRAAGKTVEILGYINDTKTERKVDITVFNKKSLTWCGVPTDEKALAFAEKNFDLLLACFIGENLPLEYLSCISKARWRVGAYYPGKTNCYDMMVNVGDRQEVQYFLDQASDFLNKINYDTATA